MKQQSGTVTEDSGEMAFQLRQNAVNIIILCHCRCSSVSSVDDVVFASLCRCGGAGGALDGNCVELWTGSE